MHTVEKVPISLALARKLQPLAVSVFVLIALVLPLSFGAIENRRLENTAANYARQFADVVKTIASSSPRLWKFQATKYSEAMDVFFPHKDITAIRVLDRDGTSVSQLSHSAAPYGFLSAWMVVEGEPAAIVLNNTTIGEVRIQMEVGSAMFMVVSVLMTCMVIGSFLSLLLYRLPLRVVRDLEQELFTYQDSLEELVQERTIDLQDARTKAEAANRAKGLFLANMSHEIRTPMNAIIGMTHLAMQAKTDDQRRRFLKTVQHASESLLGLLNDILDFSKMEAGQLQLNPAPFNLRRLLHGIVSTLNVPAVEKGLTLTVQISDHLPDVLIGDDMRLRQILLNLVGNAIKFTPAGSVTISAAPDTMGNEDAVHCTVTDTGIGIPADKCALIFNSFEQADSTHARQFGGTGLGLSICSQLVSLMGGRIWAESQQPAGSAFHFIVPLPASSEQPAELPVTEQVVPMAITGLRILVVDDNEVNRDVASLTLEQAHEVATAGNGLEALTLLASRPFDLVLMDVQMPAMDGLTATAMIRALEQEQPLPRQLPEPLHSDLAARLRGGHVPIVAMTAHAMGEDREMCLAAGMDSYITKPFQPSELSRTLYSLMEKHPLQTRIDREPENTPVGTSLQAAPILPPTLEQVAAHLQTATGLNPNQVGRLLRAACLNVRTSLFLAKDQLDARDFPALAQTADTLQKGLLQCGLLQLADLAGQLHHAALTGALPNNGAQLQQLEELLAPLIDD